MRIATSFLCAALLLATAAAAEPPALAAEVDASGQRIVVSSRHEGNWEIYSANAAGTEAVNLTNTPDADEGCPRVSFDGRHLAFVKLGRKRSYEQDRGQVFLFDLVTGERTKIEPLDRADALAWSPDSKELAASWGAGERKSKGVRIYNLGTKEVRAIAPTAGGISDIDWSGCGKYFAFGARDSFGLHWQIMVMNADGTGIRRLAHARKGGFCHPAWSRANEIAVNCLVEGLIVARFDVEDPKYTIDTRKKSKDWRTLLDLAVNPHNSNPRWSPCGKYILWSMPPGKRPTRTNINSRRLYVVRAADGAWAPVGPKDFLTATVDYDWFPAPKKEEKKEAEKNE